MEMTTNKPYLVRAIYDWIIDNHMTPYLLVDATYQGVEVPMAYVSDGKIVLNISKEACRGLQLDHDKIIFTARFGAVASQIVVVMPAVLAIYAEETRRGMEFAEEHSESFQTPVETPKKKSVFSGWRKQKQKNTPKKPFLTLVKSEDDDSTT